MQGERQILLVEDDVVDVMTIKRALRELEVPMKLEVSNSGEEALQYLKDENTALPSFILLDINMPKMNGIEFLELVKNEKNLKRIPIVVFTTSKEESDRKASFDLNAAGYMIKPTDYDEFIRVFKTIVDYWQLSEST